MSGIAGVIGIDSTFSVTPTVSSSPAYTANDQVGGIMQLSGAIKKFHRPLGGDGSAVSQYGIQRGHTQLTSILVKSIDTGFQPIINFWIFNDLPTLNSSDNAALSFNDSELSKLVGVVSMDSIYQATALNIAAEKTNLNVLLPQVSTMAHNDLWVVAQVLSGGSFSSTSSLSLLFKFYHD